MDQKNLDMYGGEPIPWSRALEQLEAQTLEVGHGVTYWLATVRPGGRPHIAAVGALWVDGKFYFTSGAGTRKSRNLAENPNCVISVSLGDLDPRRRGHGRPGDRQPHPAARRKALRSAGMAGARECRRDHRRVQRAQRRPPSVGLVRRHTVNRLRGGHGRAQRCVPLALLTADMRKREAVVDP